MDGQWAKIMSIELCAVSYGRILNPIVCFLIFSIGLEYTLNKRHKAGRGKLDRGLIFGRVQGETIEYWNWVRTKNEIYMTDIYHAHTSKLSNALEELEYI